MSKITIEDKHPHSSKKNSVIKPIVAIAIVFFILDLKFGSLLSFKTKLFPLFIIFFIVIIYYSDEKNPYKIIINSINIEGWSLRKGHEIFKIDDIKSVNYRMYLNLRSGLVITFKNGRKWKFYSNTFQNYSDFIERVKELGYLK